MIQKKILIFGYSGGIGRSLVNITNKNKYKLFCYNKKKINFLKKNSISKIQNVLKKVKADIIINTSGVLGTNSDEYEKIFEVGFDAFERWLDKLNSDEDLTDNVNDIEEIIKNQNTYCEHQASNKRTFGALKANIGEEKAKFFMEEVLFPKIKYDKMS